MKRIAIAGIAALSLAGCGMGDGPRPATASRPAPRVPVPSGITYTPIGAVQGQSAGALIATFGQPRIDMQEGAGRKIQFAGPACVLDAYLYAPAQGKEPVVTHVDTRRRDGAPADQAGCIAALTKRQ